MFNLVETKYSITIKRGILLRTVFFRLVEGEAGEVRWWFQLRTGMTLFP